MTTKSKLFLFLSAMFIFGISNTACTQQKQETTAKETAKVEVKTEVSDVAANLPGIFELNSVGQAAPNKIVDFAYSQDGKNMSVADYAKGKYIFLNFWGTWCPPCRHEIPDIIQIQKDLEGELVVIGVALERAQDFLGAKKTVSDFVTRSGINYLNVVVPFASNLKPVIAEAYGGIQFVPTTFLIDKDGNIFEKIQGGRSKEDFMKSINKMMKKS